MPRLAGDAKWELSRQSFSFREHGSVQSLVTDSQPSYGTDIARRYLRSIRKRVPNLTDLCCSHTSADLRAVCSGWPELPEVASDGNTGIAEYVMGLVLRAIDSAYRGAA